MAKNSNLSKAKTAKNDEFYTQLTDVEKELKHYKEHFKNKTILCNCDDPVHSAFWKYFHLNFNHLGLKKLISTHYLAQQFKWDLNAEKPYVMEYTGEDDNDVNVGTKTYLKGDGDFRSVECIEFLKESDIVVTNPPFSLFREFVAILMKYEKKFIIIGNKNAITYKEFFPLLRDNKVWLGVTMQTGGRFILPESTTNTTSSAAKVNDEGRHTVVISGAHWFTNLDIAKRHEKLILFKTYNPEEYPKYDNYNAINVDKVADIPVDYKGVMGVPITFLDKYNPEQFEIIQLAASHGSVPCGIPNEAGYLRGKWVYARILIKYR
jgi:hypothetical protein